MATNKPRRMPTEQPIRQPHKCDCFGGFCMRNLCFQKNRRVESKSTETTPKEPREQRPILAWRWDGSHEKGPIPRGRLPERKK